MFIPIKEALKAAKSGRKDDDFILDEEFDYFPDRSGVEIIDSIKRYRDTGSIDKPLLSTSVISELAG